ncbi:MAG: glycosyltransferase, partial [Deltaproteobacteria bacterium]
PSVLTLADYWFICPQIQMLKPNLELCPGPKGGINCLTCGSAVPFIYYASDSLSFLPEPSRQVIRTLLNWTKKSIPNELKSLFLKSSYPEATGSLTYFRLQYLLGLLNMANLVIAPSRFLREKFLEAGIDEEKIIHSDYGFNQLSFENFSPKSSDQLRFGFIGTIAEHKGVHLLIEAFNKLYNEQAELRIYGSPEVDPKYFSRIEKLVKSPRIRFLGGFDNKDVAKILSEIDVIIVPSIWWENSPLTIHEAFMAKIPVITSNIGGMAELVQDGVNGYLFKVGESEDLGDKIKSIIDKPERITEFKNGITPVKSIEENAAELEAIYKSIYLRE